MEVERREQTGMRPGEMTPKKRLSIRPVFRALFCCLSFTLSVGAVNSPAAAGGAKAAGVAVVVGQEAPELERHAARELCGYLEKLYGIHTAPVVKLTSPAEVTLLVGSPATNPEVVRALGNGGWPGVTSPMMLNDPGGASSGKA